MACPKNFGEGALFQRNGSIYNGERVIDDQQPSSEASQYPARDHFSNTNERFDNAHAQKFDEGTTAAPESEQVCATKYQRVVDENVELLQELQLAKADAAKATKPCQDSAAWVYHERSRLLKELADARSSIPQSLEQAVKHEKSVFAKGAMAFLIQEVNNARAEVGLLPLSQEQMSIRLRLNEPRTKASNECQLVMGDERVNEITALDRIAHGDGGNYLIQGEGARFIAEQVDALIAEEQLEVAIPN